MYQKFLSIFADGSESTLEKGGELFRTGESVRMVHLVVDGRVDLIRHTASGNRLVLFRAINGNIPAEASAYSKNYHCDGVAADDSKLLSIPKSDFLAKLEQDAELAGVWAKSLAHALQAARMNSEIRTLRKVEERLDAWLAVHNSLPPKGQWQDLAQTLGISREALYRELARRRS